MLQGLCEMDAGDAATAVTSFVKVLSLNTKMDKKEDVCDTKIQLALAYLR